MRFLKAILTLAVCLLSALAFAQAAQPQSPPPTQQNPADQPNKQPGDASQKPTTPEQSPKPQSDQAQKPVAQKNTKPGFSIDNIDRSADPCVDFYQFACGNWIKSNPIPSDQASWDSFTSVYVQNQDILRNILEKVATDNPGRSVVDRQIGDFYYACMDDKGAETKALNAIKPELDRISALKDKGEMMELLAHIHLVGPNPIFGFGSQPDFHNAGMEIAGIDQSGLTMPDRDYYLKDEEKFLTLRKAFVEYMENTFKLMGQNPQQAKTSAQTVLNIETDLARAFMDRTLRRDPKNTDHKMHLADVEKLGPNFQLARYLKAINAPNFADLNVGNPDFFKQTNATITKYPLDAWKTYLTWQMMNFISPWLSDPYVKTNFKFQQALSGQQEIQVRWKRCVDLTDSNLGEALGQPYVAQTFGPEGKERMLKMVSALEKSLDQDIANLPWMTPETKKQAKVKLDAIYNMIGYPDKWRDYSSIKIARDDLAGNILRTVEFESRRQNNKIGKPVDRKEWGMTPPTVNAYYSGTRNEIVFPAGILQPPFFDRTMDDAVNFGGIGAVIGHELTHGFDDQGRKFDPKGNLSDWWTPVDAKEFETRASCVADEYSNFISIDTLKLNGRLTLGENTADNGGARIALMALLANMQQGKSTNGGGTEQAAEEKKDGFTPEQRFFLGFAGVWCENRTPELARMLVSVDPHSPGKYRTNGVVQNMPEFQKAWNCKTGQPMVKANACHVW
jgi:endothelin-converting enzyme/putative endopeptidase